MNKGISKKNKRILNILIEYCKLGIWFGIAVCIFGLAMCVIQDVANIHIAGFGMGMTWGGISLLFILKNILRNEVTKDEEQAEVSKE